jgi:hypothetical protein
LAPLAVSHHLSVPLLLALGAFALFRRVCVFVFVPSPRASLRLEFSPPAAANKGMHAYVPHSRSAIVRFRREEIGDETVENRRNLINRSVFSYIIFDPRLLSAAVQITRPGLNPKCCLPLTRSTAQRETAYVHKRPQRCAINAPENLRSLL